MGALAEFLKTMTDITEERQKSRISIPVYCFAILLFFCEVTGYVFYSTPHRQITEEKVNTLSLFLLGATYPYLLNLVGYDALTIIFIYGAWISVFLLTGYILALTLLRQTFPRIIQSNYKHIKAVNLFLNKIFVFFDWIFLMPILDILSGTSFCNGLTYINYYKDKCDIYPIHYEILSRIAIACVFLIGIGITVLYRNYEFNEQELMKPKYSLNNLIQFILVFLYCVVTYWTTEYSFSIVDAQILDLTFQYDILFWSPFPNRFIMQFYTIMVLFSSVGTKIFSIWYYFKNVPDIFVFYGLFLFLAVLAGVAIVIQEKKYEKVMNLSSINFQKQYSTLDVYLEELFRLENAQKSHLKSKFILIKILLKHTQNCVNVLCPCKRMESQNDQSPFLDRNGIFITEKIHLLIEFTFQWGLQQQVVQKDRREFENISLKYISFLTKYRNNPVQAFYMLKSLGQKKQNLGFFFRTISGILSNRIIESMKLSQKQSELDTQQITQLQGDPLNEFNNIRNDSSVQNELSIDKFMLADAEIDKIIFKLKEYSHLRRDFWRAIMEDSMNMSGLLNQTLKISKYGILLEKEVNSLFFMQNKEIWKNSAKMVKTLAIFKLLVKSDVNSAAKLEKQFSDLLQADINKNQQKLSNLNYVKGNIAVVSLSLSKEKNRIISKKNEKFLNFFGYSKEDEFAVSYVDQLMPEFIGRNHQNLIDNYLNRGYSKLLGAPMQTLAKTKSGFIFGINIILNSAQIDPNDFILHGLLTSNSQEKGFIVMLGDTSIEGISLNLFQQLFNKEKKVTTNLKKATTTIMGVAPATTTSIFQPLRSVSQARNQFRLTLQDLYEKVSLLFLIPDLARNLLEALIQSREEYKDYSKKCKNNKKKEQSSSFSQTHLFKKDLYIQIPEQIFALQKKFTMLTSLQVSQQQSMTSAKVMTVASSSNNSSNMFKQPRKYSQNGRNSADTSRDHQEKEGVQLDSNIINPTEDSESESNQIIKYLNAFCNFHQNHQKEWQGRSLISQHKATITVRSHILSFQKDKNHESCVSYVLEIENVTEIPFKYKLQERAASFEQNQSLKSKNMLAVSAGGNNNSSFMNNQAFVRQGSGFLAQKSMLKGEEMEKAFLLLKTNNNNNNNNNNGFSMQVPIKNKITGTDFSTTTEKPFLESMISPMGSDKSHLLEFNSPKFQKLQEISMVSQYLSAVLKESNQEDQSKVGGEYYEKEEEGEENLDNDSQFDEINNRISLSPEINFQQYQQNQPKKKILKRQESSIQSEEKQDDSKQLSSAQTTQQNQLASDAIESDRNTCKSYECQPQQRSIFTPNKTKKRIPQMSANNSNCSSSANNSSIYLGINIIKIINKQILPSAVRKFRLILCLITVLFLLMIHSSSLFLFPQVSEIVDVFYQFQIGADFLNAITQSSIFSLVYYKAEEIDLNIPIELKIEMKQISQANSQELIKEFFIQNQQSQSLFTSISKILGDRQFPFFLFSNQEEQPIEGTFYTIKIQNYFQAAKNTQIIRDSLLHYDSFFYLIANFETNLREGFFAILNLRDGLNKQISYCENIARDTFILETVVFSLLATVCGIFMRQIRQIFVKVLLIVTRMNVSEGLKEIAKLDQIEQSLGQIEVNSSWLKMDYIKAFEGIQNVDIKRDYKDGQREDQEKGTKSNQISNTKNIKKNQKEQLLSSLLKDTRLNNIPSLLILISLFISVILFSSILLIFSSSFSSSMATSLKVFIQISDAKINFASLLMHSELLSTYQLFHGSKALSFPKLNITSIQQNMLNEVQQLRTFNEDYISLTQSSSILYHLFQENLCSTLVCKDPNEKDHLFHGLSDLISQTITLIDSNKDLFFGSSFIQNNDYVDINSENYSRYQNTLKTYVSDSQYQNIILLSHDIPQSAFKLAKEYAQMDVQSSVDKFKIFLFFYFSIISSILVIIIGISAFLFFRKVKNELISINFSLFLISMEKLTEDNTKHLLKQLLKDYQ